MARILVVEDEPSTLNVLSTLLKTEGYEVMAIDNGDQAFQLLETEGFDLMLSDIRMTPIDGMQLLKHAREIQPHMSVIMLTGYGTVETAVGSLKLGAFDYITKPFKVDELFLTVQKALESAAAHAAAIGNQPTEEHYGFENLVAASEAMRMVCEMVKRVAQTEVMVLIDGEDGVGKSLVAKTLHGISKRKSGPFICVSCAEMSESALNHELFGTIAADPGPKKSSAFEQASEGTLYIDGIHAMPLGIQDRLLSILQNKQWQPEGAVEPVALDFRLVTSTNTHFDVLVDAGTIREELYYRLSALPIEIKPLRERPEDILPMVFHVLSQSSEDGSALPSLTPEACAILEQYRWPGNVRELETAVKHALSVGRTTLSKEALPPDIVADVRKRGIRITRKTSEAEAYRARSLKAFLHYKEKDAVAHALETSGGDLTVAAKTMKITPIALKKKIDLLGLK